MMMYLRMLMFSLAALPSAALAQDAPLTLDKIDEWLNNIKIFLFSSAVLIGIIFIIASGIRWMTAGDDPKQVEKAKNMLKAAIIGTAVVLGVGVILSTIASIF